MDEKTKKPRFLITYYPIAHKLSIPFDSLPPSLLMKSMIHRGMTGKWVGSMQEHFCRHPKKPVLPFARTGPASLPSFNTISYGKELVFEDEKNVI